MAFDVVDLDGPLRVVYWSGSGIQRRLLDLAVVGSVCATAASAGILGVEAGTAI